MRWFFLLLLLMNAGLFAWQHRSMPTVDGELSLVSPAVVPAMPSSAQRLSLLTEVEARARGNVTEPATWEGASCLVLGGFEAVERVRQLEQRLLSLDIAVRIVATETSIGADQWVYIPPLASRQASQRQLRELKARGIDSYLILEGELANGILLGVFSRMEVAMTLADRLRTAGYAPQVRELPRIYQEYWVRVAEKSRRLVSDNLLQRLHSDFSDLKHKLISCSGVAYR